MNERSDAAREHARLFHTAYFTLICLDVLMFIWHFALLVNAWHAGDYDSIIELSFGITHFLTNTIAIADLYMHLWHFLHSTDCVFASSKSTNCFMYSTIGVYADIVATALCGVSGGARRWHVLALYICMVCQGAACALLSVGLYIWGTWLSHGRIASSKCEHKTLSLR